MPVHAHNPPTLVEGTNGNDRLFGSSGSDRLVAHGGLDYLDGGKGSDTMVFDKADTGLGAQADTLARFGAKDMFELHGFAAGATWAVHEQGNDDRVQILEGRTVVAEFVVGNHYHWDNDDFIFV